MTRLLLLCAALLLATACKPERPVVGQLRTAPSTETSWEVLAVRYGHVEAAPQKTWVAGGKSDLIEPVLMLYVLRQGDQVVLVDTGAPKQAGLAPGQVLDIAPSKALAEAGIEPKDVTDVLLTTYHHERVADVDRYANARVWIQSAGLAGARWRLSRSGNFKRIRKGSIRKLEAIDAAGRLELMDTSFEIMPGIQAHTGSVVHTWYTWFSVNTDAGVVVLAGDVAPLWRNVGRSAKVPGQNARTWQNTLQTMKILTEPGGRIVPGMEPAVFQDADRVSEHVVRIAP